MVGSIFNTGQILIEIVCLITDFLKKSDLLYKLIPKNKFMLAQKSVLELSPAFCVYLKMLKL